jgi:RNA polymerase sigma-70 factor (ECF subfamily)
MAERDLLAERFEEQRGRLRGVAYRMLGSLSEAEDAVQESWFRLNRADAADIHNLGGWLTTVVARVCLDMLRSRSARREESLDASVTALNAPHAAGGDPEQEALLADSVGLALLVVLDTLAPAERLAFVLHDMFAVPFEEIAPIVDRSPAAARQLASRARRRVQGVGGRVEAGGRVGAGVEDTTLPPSADLTRQREVVDAFLAAARGGDFAGLLAVLDPDVVFRADPEAVRIGASPVVRGASAVATNFSGQARAARPALVNGAIGAVWAPGGKPRVVLNMTIADGKIVAIDAIAEPARLGGLELAVLND